MPEFSQRPLLALLLLVPPLVWWWLRQPRAGIRFSATAALAGLPAGRSRWARWGGAALRGLILSLLVVGLAGPRWPDRGTRIATEGIAIMMLVDVSGSMAEPDFDWHGEPMTRLDAVKRAFKLFVGGGDGPGGKRLEGRPSDLIGLVTFATRPDCPCPLTLSHAVLLRTLDEEQPRSVPGESQTTISDAIALGLYRLQSAGTRRKVVVLLSDGEHNVPHAQSEWTPRQAAQIAANLRVPVYAIDAGGEGTLAEEGGTPDTSAASRQHGIQTLQELARITQGRYFQAQDAEALLGVCQEIDRLERQEIQSFQYRRYYEGYPWFGLAAFVLVLTTWVLETTVWRRLP